MSGPAPQDAAHGVDERLAAQIETIALARIADDKLVLPAFPLVTARCLEFLRRPDHSVQKAAAIIETDPILAARLVRLANSAAFATREPARSIQTAAARLGVNRLRTALIEVSARPVLESRDPRITVAARGMWEHSLAVALIARDAAVICALPDPEDAYLAGLLHDVGKPVLATLLLEAETMVAARGYRNWVNSDVWIAVLQRTHRKVGVALARRWALPEGVCNAIEECGDYDPVDRRSVANVVRLANALAKKEGVYVGPAVPEQEAALVMVGRSLLDVDDAALGRRTVGLRERVRSAG